jgi:hypothetical protein
MRRRMADACTIGAWTSEGKRGLLMRLRRNWRRVNRESSRSATARYIFHARDLAPWSEVGKSGAASVKSLNEPIK